MFIPTPRPTPKLSIDKIDPIMNDSFNDRILSLFISALVGSKHISKKRLKLNNLKLKGFPSFECLLSHNFNKSLMSFIRPNSNKIEKEKYFVKEGLMI